MRQHYPMTVEMKLAMAMAKADLSADAKKTAGYHFVQCEINLLGDPTLRVAATKTGR